MTIENFVRPFQLPQNAPTRQVNAPAQQPEPVRSIAGHGGGSPKLFSGSYSGTFTYYLKKIAREVISE